MTHNTTARPTAAQMLHETQGYRTSLEALMSVGKVLLLNPSLESDGAASFKVLAENVLEQADHQADLQVVDGVEEPAAQVELIMQDVLTPRLTEVEQIETALQEKADSAEPVPFTTRDTETSASLESANFKVEALGLFQENIQTLKTVCSMEGISVDAVRPLVMNVARRVDDALPALAISMEELEQTQVLGDMADAVDRIEQLVNTAREQAEESAQAARSEAESLGGEGTDRIGDLIEQHRSDNPSGVKLDEGTNATTIESDTPQSAPNLDGGDPLVTEEGIEASGIDQDNGGAGGDAGDGTDAGADGLGDGTDGDLGDGTDGLGDGTDGNLDAGLGDGTDGDLGDGTDAGDGTDGLGDEASTVDAANDSADAEAEAAAAAAAEEEENEEEEEEGAPSTESQSDPIVIEDISARVQDVDTVVAYTSQLFNWLDSNGLLTAEGKAAMGGAINESFKFDTSMVVTAAGDVLVRHYDTWIAGCIRDGECNTRALSVLMGF